MRRIGRTFSPLPHRLPLRRHRGALPALLGGALLALVLSSPGSPAAAEAQAEPPRSDCVSTAGEESKAQLDDAASTEGPSSAPEPSGPVTTPSAERGAAPTGSGVPCASPDEEDVQRLSPGSSAAAIQIAMYEEHVVASSGAQARVLMRITNAAGQALPNETITVVSDDPAHTLTEVEDLGDGRYRAGVTASDRVGTATLTATVATTFPEVTGNVTLTQTLGLPALTSTFSLSLTELPADGKATTEVTVSARDFQGRLIPGARMSLASTDPGQLLSELVETVPGEFTATVRASTTPGTSTLSLWTGDLPNDAVLPPPLWWADAQPPVAGDLKPDAGRLYELELTQRPTGTDPGTGTGSGTALPPALANTGAGAPGGTLAAAAFLTLAGGALFGLRRTRV